MALNFPTSPSVGVQTSIGDKTWEYDGKGWKLLPNSSLLATERIKALDNSSSTTLYPVMVDQIGVSTYIFAGQTRSLVYNASTGNLGIGTTNASSKLTVSGNVNISGIVTATSYRGDGSQLTGINVSSGLDITSSLFI